MESDSSLVAGQSPPQPLCKLKATCNQTHFSRPPGRPGWVPYGLAPLYPKLPQDPCYMPLKVLHSIAPPPLSGSGVFGGSPAKHDDLLAKRVKTCSLDSPAPWVYAFKQEPLSPGNVVFSLACSSYDNYSLCP